MICNRCNRIVNEVAPNGMCRRCNARAVLQRKMQTANRRLSVSRRILGGDICG